MKPPIREDFAPLKGKGSTRRLYARFGVATFFPLPLRAEMIRARWAQAWRARNTK